MQPEGTRAACIVILLSATTLWAQETAGQRHGMATNQLIRIAAERSARCLSDVQTLDDWKKQRVGLRRQLLEMLGLDPLPERTSLRVQITGRLERDAYRIEKIVFHSLPGLYVTGNFSDVDQLLPLFGRYTVLLLNPRLTEQPMSAAEYADVERTAVWTGRTVAAMQVWDILRAVRWVTEDQGISASRISLYGKGEMGILALYAALFDERIEQVILNDPPASHWQGPALLNVLRVTDITEVAGGLAPRRLVSLTKLPEAFDYTKRIYGLRRASNQFVQSGSLPEALEVWRYPVENLTPRSAAAAATKTSNIEH